MTRQMTGAQIVIQALRDQGVDTVFGYPGGAVLPIYDELFQQNDIRHILGALRDAYKTEIDIEFTANFQPDGSYSMRHLSVGHAEPLRAELQAFVGAIRNGKEPAVTGEEGRG